MLYLVSDATWSSITPSSRIGGYWDRIQGGCYRTQLANEPSAIYRGKNKFFSLLPSLRWAKNMCNLEQIWMGSSLQFLFASLTSLSYHNGRYLAKSEIGKRLDTSRSRGMQYHHRVHQDVTAFFGIGQLPHPRVATEILHNRVADDMVDRLSYELMRYMDEAGSLVPEEESAVADFAAALMRVVSYNERPGMVRAHIDIPFTICGEYRHATTDVCIKDANEIVLLIQEDKCHLRPNRPGPQLVAEAIATFQANNNR